MREILFRGKRVYNGGWVYGYYRQTYGCSLIICEQGDDIYGVAVRHETVGQYTGLMALNGKIFEHDVVTAKFKSNGARFNFVVKYDNQKGGYIFDNGRIKALFEQIRSVRVIGNIHDNPELMGRKGDGE